MGHGKLWVLGTAVIAGGMIGLGGVAYASDDGDKYDNDSSYEHEENDDIVTNLLQLDIDGVLYNLGLNG